MKFRSSGETCVPRTPSPSIREDILTDPVRRKELQTNLLTIHREMYGMIRPMIPHMATQVQLSTESPEKNREDSLGVTTTLKKAILPESLTNLLQMLLTTHQTELFTRKNQQEANREENIEESPKGNRQDQVFPAQHPIELTIRSSNHQEQYKTNSFEIFQSFCSFQVLHISTSRRATWISHKRLHSLLPATFFLSVSVK